MFVLSNTELGHGSHKESGKGKKRKRKKGPIKRIIFDVIEQESDQ